MATEIHRDQRETGHRNSFSFHAPRCSPPRSQTGDTETICFALPALFFCLPRCAFFWRPGKTAAVAATTGRAVVGAVSVAVAVAAIALGIFLPGYLQRAGIAVPAHCGGD